jgi:signal transduction histidine kinase
MVVDGNEAAASIAYRCNELMFIYPITPASAMGELSAARLGRVVESLLALARTEHERPARGRVDLGAVVAERGATWGAIARERGVDLTVPQSRRKTWALATPGHLEQILDNLIANALDASPSGATVAVTIGSHEGRVEVHVADEVRG